MLKLHLVGFTTDLKNLIFSRRSGAKSGGYMVVIDERLLRTLQEVDRLAEEARQGRDTGLDVPEVEAAPPRPKSQLTPKEIQALLRRGRSVEEVARAAGTDMSWIDRFTGPIFAEQATIVDAVRSAWIAKPRKGRSSAPVGDAVAANLRARRVRMDPEDFDAAWDAVRRDGTWEVTFRYVSRGQRREATFEFDPETRHVRAANAMALQLGWRAPEPAPGDEERRAAAKTGAARPGRRPAPAKAAAKARTRSTRVKPARPARPPRGGNRTRGK